MYLGIAYTRNHYESRWKENKIYVYLFQKYGQNATLCTYPKPHTPLPPAYATTNNNANNY